MAIKTTTQETLPAITVDYIQFSEVHIRVSKTDPYVVAVSAKVSPYGVDGNGKRHYTGTTHDIIIKDMDSFINGLTGDELINAASAMQSVQEGLGILAEVKLGIEFSEYE